MSFRRGIVVAWVAALCGCGGGGGGNEGAGAPPIVGQFPGQGWESIAPATATRRPFAGIEAAPEIEWVRRTPDPPPADAPAFYGSVAVGVDTKRNLVYKFGGRRFPQLSNELWSWDPVSGDFLLLGGSLDGPPLQGWPTGGSGYQLVEDRARQVMLLTVGAAFWDVQGDRFVEHPQDFGDSASGDGVLAAYDTKRQRVAVFGSTNGRIWWYDAKNHDYEPAGRVPMYEPATGMVYHEARDTYVIAAITDILGEWDPKDNTWADLSPLTKDEMPIGVSEPYAACVAPLVYLPAKQRVFTHCHHGNPRDFEIDVATNTWYSTLSTSQESPGNSALILQPLTYDTVRSRVIAISTAGVMRVGVWERPQ